MIGRMTRLCTDPWDYMEITAEMGMRPCCTRPAILADGEFSLLQSLDSHPKMVRIREGLLTGDLEGTCQTCTLRQMVPTEKLQQAVADREIFAPKQLRIELTKTCNMRCTYCAVFTNPNYQNISIDPLRFDEIFAVVDRMPPNADIFVSGHGETTFHPHWFEFCTELVNRGRRLQITTNLAKVFTPDEVDLLARFTAIAASADSHDDALLSSIRKPITWTKIVDQINLIRRASERLGTAPVFTLNIGLYDPSIWGVAEFVERAIDLGIGGLSFWDLNQYPRNTSTRRLDKLDVEQTAQARAILQNVKELLEKSGIPHEFVGEFPDRDGRSLVHERHA